MNILTWWRKMGATVDYDARVRHQIEQFRNPEQLKKLPPIYRYWSQTHLAPLLTEVFGTKNTFLIYAEQFAEALGKGQSRRVLSIGAGDCKTEIAIAKELVKMQIDDFVIDCAELSSIRLERGRKLADEEEMRDHLAFLEVDLNDWQTSNTYAGVMAHHTLHHIVELERIFERTVQLMDDEGVFVSMDMIGRNGHMRWPETLDWMERIWAFLPDRFKFNHQFGRQIDPYLNWDCSKKGFEGIRAQDVLPLLLRNFSLTHFLGVGGIVDVFVERGYGHNFDVDNPSDTALIDFIQYLNTTLIDQGSIKPTMMFAVMRKKDASIETKHHGRWSPEFCVRQTPPSE